MPESKQPGPHPPAGGGWLSRERALAFVLMAETALAFYVCYRLLGSQASRGAEALKAQVESGQLQAAIESSPGLSRVAGWGTVVIGSIDNLLYPVLVGDRVRMHTLLIFFSVVGGLMLFGSEGLVQGWWRSW